MFGKRSQAIKYFQCGRLVLLLSGKKKHFVISILDDSFVKSIINNAFLQFLLAVYCLYVLL